jgi:chaperone modulatory protein CbpM
MNEEIRIPAGEFCTYYQIELSFIHSLQDYGLIEVVREADDEFIPENQLGALERMIRMHYELDINLEGIDAISHLLERVEEMQHEMTRLQNRLRFYEVTEGQEENEKR